MLVKDTNREFSFCR